MTLTAEITLPARTSACSKSRVLLINPHEMTQGGFINPPLGLLYLAGTLLAHGRDVRIVDGCIDGPEGVRAAIREYQPDLVGITALTPARKRAFEVAEWSKAILPTVPVVLGGAHPTIMWEQILTRYPAVDCIVCGEGEQTLLEIAEGREWDQICGIVYRDKTGIRKTSNRFPIANLDDIPFPAWHLIDLERYPFVGQKIGEPRSSGRDYREIPVVFSRGCLGRCDFCSTWWIWKSWRHRSPRNMAEELEMLTRRFHVKHFGFVDDMMTGDIPATAELCDLIVERGLDIAFAATTRADCVNAELLEKMKSAGCYSVGYGIETGSPDILKAMGKDNLIENSIRAIRLTREAGMKAAALIIVGNRGETDASIKATVRLLRKAKPDSVGCVGGLWIFPGTKLYRECQKEGFIDDEFWLSDEPYKVYTREHGPDDLRRYARMVTYYDLPRKAKAIWDILANRRGRIFEIGMETVRRRLRSL